MEVKRLEILLEKLRNGICSEAEQAEIDAFYYSLDDGVNLKLPQYIDRDPKAYVESKLIELKAQLAGRKTDSTSHRMRVWLKVAAVLILLLGIGMVVYIIVGNKDRTEKQIAVQDMPPGRTGALLTLSDGSTIILDSVGNGTVAQQNNVKVVNINGSLAYRGKTNGSVAFNTLSTPKARQYRLILPDGTKVWLNAASSLRYPVAFTGKERKVELTGEAYFEVTHMDALPFKVIAGNTEIMDIGTHFNIYAYNDEPVVKTTLLEGAISVNNKTLDIPGEQARVAEDNGISVIKVPDIDNVIAWKNNEISFTDVDIPTLMRQLSRWYNVEIIYTGKIPEGHLFGVISRKTNLSVVIGYLKENNIQCRLDDNKLIIGP